MTDDDVIEGPEHWTRYVSSIYRLAPDNPFDLPVPWHRRYAQPERRPVAPCLTLEDREPADAMAVMLYEQFLRELER
jgi:hypothetical protein